jgi:hypothetical protein
MADCKMLQQRLPERKQSYGYVGSEVLTAVVMKSCLLGYNAV